jgi:hypothetical protein
VLKLGLAGVAAALVRETFPLARPVRLLGVTVSGFDPLGGNGGAQAALDLGLP